MKITFNELREIKHQLPTGSVSRIAETLKLEEQTVRNYFGANKYEEGDVVNRHVTPGPNGGIVDLDRTDILDIARQIIEEEKVNPTV
jgi:hypothetical protein